LDHKKGKGQKDFKGHDMWGRDLGILSPWWFPSFFIKQTLGKCWFIDSRGLASVLENLTCSMLY